MNIAFVRTIDRWIGVPICFVLTILNALCFWRHSAQKQADVPHNILFIELSEMGSAILASSALQKTRELFPNANLYFLIFQEHAPSVHLTGLIPADHVLTIDHRSLFRFLQTMVWTLANLRKNRIDTVIDLELFSRFTAILSLCSGAQRRVGFHRFQMEGLYRGNFLTHPVQYNVYQHIAVNFLSLVYALGAAPEDSPLLKQRLFEEPTVPRVKSTTRQKAAIFAKLQAIQPDLRTTDTLIVFNPDAGLLPIRAWPLAKYAQLARKLVLRHDRTFVVVMGVNGATAAARAIAREIGPRCIDLTNQTTLREVIDLFNIAHVLVTNDSGPAHCASLTPIKNFVFFGPETPELYGPLGENAFPIYARYSCSPCLSAYNHRNTTCRNPRCVTTIAVDEVYALIMTHSKQ